MKVYLGEQFKNCKLYGQEQQVEREGYYMVLRCNGYETRMPIDTFNRRIKDGTYRVYEETKEQ